MGRFPLVLAAAFAASGAQAQSERIVLRQVGVSAFFPHIPRDDFDFAGISVDLRLAPLDKPWFVDLDFRGYHASRQDVLVLNPAIGYGYSRGRIGGTAAIGVAYGGSSGGKAKTGLSGTLGVSYAMKRNLWAEARYVFVGPDGLGGFMLGVTFGVR